MEQGVQPVFITPKKEKMHFKARKSNTRYEQLFPILNCFFTSIGCNNLQVQSINDQGSSLVLTSHLSVPWCSVLFTLLLFHMVYICTVNVHSVESLITLQMKSLLRLLNHCWAFFKSLIWYEWSEFEPGPIAEICLLRNGVR